MTPSRSGWTTEIAIDLASLGITDPAHPFAMRVCYRPALSSRPIGGYGQVQTLTLDVPDEPLVVELTPTK